MLLYYKEHFYITMKKTLIALFVAGVTFAANAEYQIQIPLEQDLGGILPTGSLTIKNNWINSVTNYGEWINQGGPYNCINWTPNPNTVIVGQSFTQTANDCSQNQVRSAQDTEIETISKIIRNVGNVYYESRTIVVSSTRESIGSLETWVVTEPTYTTWNNVGSVYECQTWSPSPTTITINQPFTQSSDDCKQNQERIMQNREIETTTNQLRDVGEPVMEYQVVVASGTRNAIGSKETWIAADPTYTSWVNTNELYGCTNWTPAGSTKTATATFTQTATNCKTDQSRTKQEREQESTTLTYRNVGTAVTEAKTLTAETATRSYTVTLGAWSNTDGKYGCTNWSPATSTVNSGQAFTQTATDCKQDQTRSRVEKYVDHKSGATVQVSSTSESRTISGQTSTRSATGTKATKVCEYSSVTQWIVIPLPNPNHRILVYWNGASVYTNRDFSITTFSSNGYRYTRGKVMNSANNNYEHQVCREPI